MGRIRKHLKPKHCRISSLAVSDDIRRVNEILSVNYEDKIIELLQGYEKLHRRIAQYQEDNAKLREKMTEHEGTIEYLKTSLDKTYRELEEESRKRSLADRRLQSNEQQLDFIRHILNERGPEDALERARLALTTHQPDNRRSRTSSGRPIRPSTNFSLSAGSLLDPEDVSHDRSMLEKDISRLRNRRSLSEPPHRLSSTNNSSKMREYPKSEQKHRHRTNCGKVYKSPGRNDRSFTHQETLAGPGVVTSQTRVTVTSDQRTHVDTEVRVDPDRKAVLGDDLLPPEACQTPILSSEESEFGRKVAAGITAPSSSINQYWNTESEAAPQGARKRASDDSQDSYFGLPVKKLITDPAVGEQTNTNRPCTPSENIAPDLITPVGTPLTGGKLMGRSGSASRLTKRHAFWTKTVLNLETCVSCTKRIKFGKTALKCADCKTLVHHTCKEKAPQPCIPASHHGTTPVSKSGSVHLSELCPVNETPQIPGVVIHCVNEVESRGLTQEGIYRISGTEKQVKDLLDRFLRGRPPYPSLSSVEDIHVVCGCLKLLIRRLAEPLITYELWTKFSELAETVQTSISVSDSVTRAKQLFHQLPRPNRDTLAFILLHLKKVSQSPNCSMGIDNLSKVLGPTLVGYSCEKPEPLQAIEETRCQQIIMRWLLSIPDEMYMSILQTTENQDSPLIVGKVFDTPLLRETSSSVSSLSNTTTTPQLRRHGMIRRPVFEPLFEPL